MKNPNPNEDLQDWIDALENQLLFDGKEQTSLLLNDFITYVQNKGLLDNNFHSLPFENSISEFE